MSNQPFLVHVLFRPHSVAARTLVQHSFVVPLADDDLCVDDWCRFVADVWESCASSEAGRHRSVPMQMTTNAWPLEDRLREVNFGRAFAFSDDAARNAWVSRRVIIELCRFLRFNADRVRGLGKGSLEGLQKVDISV